MKWNEMFILNQIFTITICVFDMYCMSLIITYVAKEDHDDKDSVYMYIVHVVLWIYFTVINIHTVHNILYIIICTWCVCVFMYGQTM